MRVARIAVIAAAVLGGCGRFDFDLHGVAGGGDDIDGGLASDAAARACAIDTDCGPCQRCAADLHCAAEPILDVAPGHRSTCFLGAGGSRWCVGVSVGLGLVAGDPAPLYPTRVAGEDGWTLLAPGYNSGWGIRDGAIWAWVQEELPYQTSYAGPYAQVSAQLDQVCVLATTGVATCDGTTEPGTWSYVGAGHEDYCGVQTDHSLWCWGDDNSNDLGQGEVTDPYTLAAPTRVGTTNDWLAAETSNGLSCAIKTDHTLWCWGAADLTGTNRVDTAGVPTQISPDTDWQWIAVRWRHACAGKPGGVVYCWGQDEYGLDVLPGNPNVYVPTEYPGTYDRFLPGGHHYCAENAGVWTCWGWNDYGQLGVGDTVSRQEPGGPPLCTPGS